YQPAGERRIFYSERDIIEVLLDGELPDLGNRRIVDLDFIGRVCKRRGGGPKHSAQSPGKTEPRQRFGSGLSHRASGADLTFAPTRPNCLSKRQIQSSTTIDNFLVIL